MDDQSLDSAPAAVPTGWTYLTNHSHVLILVAREPEILVRELSAQVGITDRAVQSILSDLENGGAIRRVRVGRRNTYEVDLNAKLRHPIESHCSIRDLVSMVSRPTSRTGR